MLLLLIVESAACCSKANTQGKVGGNFALVWRPAMGGLGGGLTHVQRWTPPTDSGQELFKGSFRGVQAEGGGYMQKQQGQL